MDYDPLQALHRLWTLQGWHPPTDPLQDDPVQVPVRDLVVAQVLPDYGQHLVGVRRQGPVFGDRR